MAMAVIMAIGYLWREYFSSRCAAMCSCCLTEGACPWSPITCFYVHSVQLRPFRGLTLRDRWDPFHGGPSLELTSHSTRSIYRRADRPRLRDIPSLSPENTLGTFISLSHAPSGFMDSLLDPVRAVHRGCSSDSPCQPESFQGLFSHLFLSV